jgi:N6-L-threonylcarbamoyladenine synthase
MKKLPASVTSLPKILAFDTTCDETSVAVTAGTQILSNVVASQAQLHKQFGGVFPTLAKQQHLENIGPATKLALQRAGLQPSDLAAAAITQGPGLAPALEVGITFAQNFANEHHLPLIPINHMEGHALSVLAQPVGKLGRTRPAGHTETAPASGSQLHFPVLSVNISGGHTDFTVINSVGHYHRVGWTVDDAAGEALDKFGRMVELGYPAGPLVEEFARKGDPKKYKFPLPMTTSGDYLMSFSGLKTAARKLIEQLSTNHILSSQEIYDLCASFQYAVFHAICYKLNKFLENRRQTSDAMPIFGVWLGGGVAANLELRKMLRATIKPYGLKLSVLYSRRLCGDNAAMIGVAASFKLADNHLPLVPHLERRPRWEIDEA